MERRLEWSGGSGGTGDGGGGGGGGSGDGGGSGGAGSGEEMEDVEVLQVEMEEKEAVITTLSTQVEEQVRCMEGQTRMLGLVTSFKLLKVSSV